MFRGAKIRLGLCCLFRDEDISFQSRKAGYIGKLPREEQLTCLSTTISHNASALFQALNYCHAHDIGSFRVNSGLLPLKSHPQLRYELAQLPDYARIMELFATCRSFAKKNSLRLTFHPDQFTLLSSPRIEVTHQSLAELTYHAELAELIGADVITLHGGGAYGDKSSALARLRSSLGKLPEAVRSRLTLENDDRVYSPADLLPFCEENDVPFIYDIHHHRCLTDDLLIEEVTERALKTWDREPLFHLSSPKNGWLVKDIRSHHDFIDPEDFPVGWRELEITVEIEAKAKELAIGRLQQFLKET